VETIVETTVETIVQPVLWEKPDVHALFSKLPRLVWCMIVAVLKS